MAQKDPRTVYVSLDIEADGPYHPDKYTAIEYGFAVFDPLQLDFTDKASLQKALLDKRCWSICPAYPESESDPTTMKEFWNQPKMRPKYDLCRARGIPVGAAMEMIANWIIQLNERFEKVKWLAGPTSYDILWLTRDLYRHTSLRIREYTDCCCIQSVRRQYIHLLETRHSLKCNKQEPSFQTQLDVFRLGHSHTADEDALEQGVQHFACISIDWEKSTILADTANPGFGWPQLAFHSTVPRLAL